MEIVENRRYDAKESYLAVEEKMKIVLENNAKRIILGCTHYPYLLDLLSKFAPRDIFFNPAHSLAKAVASVVKNTETAGDVDFYVTNNPDEFKRSGKMFFEINKEVQLVKMPVFSQV